MSILVITTGGTIGALPYPDPQNPPTVCLPPGDGVDVVRTVIGEKFPEIETRFVSLEPRDSKLIDDAYRENIAIIIETSVEHNIMITHGTDTLLDTANFIYSRCGEGGPLGGRTILVTGSMTPILNGEESDGFLNINFCVNMFITQNTHAGVGLVLCDFDVDGVWRPRLFPFEPGKWVKYYAPDGRFNRLVDQTAEATLD